MNKKITGLFLAAAVIVASFSGCNHTTVTTETSSITAEGTAVPIADDAVESTTLTEAKENTYEADEDYMIYSPPQRKNGHISDVTAVSEDLSTGFDISADVDIEQIKSFLDISPKLGYTVSDNGNNGYRLMFTDDIPHNSVIKIKEVDEKGVVNGSWAFQTEGELAVKSVYPEDKSDYVSVTETVDICLSAAINSENLSDYITIEPAVNGSFQVNNNIIYFLHPDDDFKTGTTYTVTLKKGLCSMGGSMLKEDYSFSFNTILQSSYDGSYFYTAYGYNETFLEGDPAVIEVYCSDDYKEKDISLRLYEYKSSDVYYTDLKNRSKNDAYKPATEENDMIFSSCGPSLAGMYEWKPRNVMLPDNLKEGYYVAVMEIGDYEEYYYLQVNPVSVFAVELGEERSFFINDTKTGGAASGTQVKIEYNGKSVYGKTDKDGLLRLNTGSISKTTENAMLDISYDGSRYISVFSVGKPTEYTPQQLYYTYLYTDRKAYLTTDTVNIWGVILPKKKGVEIPENLTVRLGYDEADSMINSVDVDKSGTFRTQFSFSNYSDMYTKIGLFSGEDCLGDTGISIEDYVKPDYIFDIELPEYAVMPHINPVIGKITASFYDGTPAQKLSFVSDAKKCTPEKPITDENGEAKAELIFNDRNEWRKIYIGHNLQLSGIQNEYNSIYDSLYGFFRDVMLTYGYDDDSHTVSAHTSLMDFEKLPQFFEDGNDDYEILRGSSYDTDIAVSIVYNWYEKVEKGTYYDYFSKKEKPLYDYFHREEKVGDYVLRTDNGKGSLADLPLNKTEGWYDVEMVYYDSLGQLVEEGFTVSTKDYTEYYYMGSEFLNYTFRAFPDKVDDLYYYNGFTENESVPIQVMCNNKEAEDGRIFFVTHQTTITDEQVYDTASFSYKTDAEDIPDFIYCGAYFDGRHVYPVNGSYLVFDERERNINFSVKTDKSEYRPGENVTITVIASDESGNPVSGAAVNLSVVDEAAFSIREHLPYTLSTVYEFVLYPHEILYSSYIQHVLDSNGGGEKGGGDFEPDSVRKDFKDTAFFNSSVTDSDGTATFTFKIADNITTWRATATGIKEYETGRILAGDGVCPIVVTQPVFITPIILSEYVVGDDIAVSANCQMLAPTDMITYSITGNGIEKTLTAAPSHTANFGKLGKGEYTVRISAEKDGGSDMIEKAVNVVDTALEAGIFNSFDLSDGISINPLRYPVDLIFYDKEYLLHTEILRSMRWNSEAGRKADIMSSFAEKEFGYITDEQFSEMLRYMTRNGIVQLTDNTNDSTSVKFSAILCTALSEYTTKLPLINDFYDCLADGGMITAMSYVGLAALGEPVLGDIKYQLETNGEIYTDTEKLWLTAAIALCGDYEAAYEYYRAYASEIYINDSNPEKITAYVNPSENNGFSAGLYKYEEKATEAALMTASVLNLPEADYFTRYIYEKNKNNPVLIAYISYFIPETEEAAEFSYKLNGKTETVELQRHRGCYLCFGEEQLRNADFKVVSGSVYVEAYYDGYITEQKNAPDINIRKSYIGKLLPGETVTVMINTGVAYCRVYDVVPSCGRYIGGKDNCINRNGQRVELVTDMNGTAKYSFCINTDGEFVVESAFAADRAEERWGISERDKMIVENTDETV